MQERLDLNKLLHLLMHETMPMFCLTIAVADKKVWEAHLCFLLAGEQFGFPSLEKTKMGMIGIDHKTTPITGRYLPLENLQMMEVLCELKNAITYNVFDVKCKILH